MRMNRNRRLVCVILLTLGLGATGSCVSKKDYLLKVEEGEKLSEELTALRSEYDRVEGEKAALDKQVVSLQGERDDLEKARTQLELKNLSLGKEIAQLKEDNLKLEELLQAKSDTLSKHIVDLRAHVADLKKENSLLKGENEDLRQNVEALQSEAQALARQRKEEMEQMRGTYEDLLEDMKAEIDKGEITITQLRGKLKVNMLDEILFDSGKTTIKPQGVEVLERLGSILVTVKDRAINIEGHTDNVPIGAELGKRYPTNWELSAARATTVARYLQEKTGIDPGFLSATGYGEYQPVAPNETEEGRARNRRIEIVLVPMEIVPVSRK
jgi:chemotaxis protein MotB